MPPKPVDKRKHRGHTRFNGRDGVWEALRVLAQQNGEAGFTLLDIEHVCREDLEMIKGYLRCLKKGGYIKRLGDHDDNHRVQKAGRYEKARYVLIRDSIETPKVRRDGTESTQGRLREQMWRTMRMLTDFTHRDLGIHASTDEFPVMPATAKDYVKYLYRAGYLILATAGGANKLARYRFNRARYTGPRAPMIQRTHQVYDPNLKQVVWSGTDDAAAEGKS